MAGKVAEGETLSSSLSTTKKKRMKRAYEVDVSLLTSFFLSTLF
jgi:hypothetical protein